MTRPFTANSRKPSRFTIVAAFAYLKLLPQLRCCTRFAKPRSTKQATGRRIVSFDVAEQLRRTGGAVSCLRLHSPTETNHPKHTRVVLGVCWKSSTTRDYGHTDLVVAHVVHLYKRTKILWIDKRETL